MNRKISQRYVSFKIYVSGLNVNEAMKLVPDHLNGTIYVAYGKNAEHAPTLVIELLCIESYRGQITELAHQLKRLFDQDAVLLTETDCDGFII